MSLIRNALKLNSYRFTPGWCTSLELLRVHGDGEVGDEIVGGFTRPVGHHDGAVILPGQTNGFHRFAHSPDLNVSVVLVWSASTARMD